MAVSTLPLARAQFFDANGNPLAGGTVGHYAPGTLTPATTWQDYLGATPNANPLTLDSAGGCQIYGSGNYRQIVKDALGNTTYDQVVALGSAGTVATVAALRAVSGVAATQIYVAGYATAGDGGEGNFIYVSTDTTSADNGGTIIVDSASRRWYRDPCGAAVLAQWFGAKGDGVTSDVTAFNNALASKAGVQVDLGPNNYYLPGQVSVPGGASLVGVEGKTTITTAAGTYNTFSLTGTDIAIKNLIIQSAAKTAGWEIFLNCTADMQRITIDNVLTWGSPGFMADNGVNIVSKTTNATVNVGNPIFMANTSGISAGMYAYHPLIPWGTTVASVSLNTSVTLSANVTNTIASGSTVQFLTGNGVVISLWVNRVQTRQHRGAGYEFFRLLAFGFFRDTVVDFVGSGSANFPGWQMDATSLLAQGAPGGYNFDNCDVEGTSAGTGALTAQVGWHFINCYELFLHRCFADTCDTYGFLFDTCIGVHLIQNTAALCNNHGFWFNNCSHVDGCDFRIQGRSGITGTAAINGMRFATGNADITLTGVKVLSATGDGISKPATQSGPINITGFMVTNCGGWGVTSVGNSAFLLVGGTFAQNTSGNYNLSGTNDYLQASQLNAGTVVSVGPGPVSG